MDVRVENCARCGEDHDSVSFREFINPSADKDGAWTHWAMCPETNEPLLLRVVLEDE